MVQMIFKRCFKAMHGGNELVRKDGGNHGP